MSQDGFLFDELSDFKKDLMRDIKENFPKETEKFIKAFTKANHLTKAQQEPQASAA